VQASKDSVQKTLKRLEEKMHGRVNKCVGFLGVQIKIPATSFVERGVQTFILLELHWFSDVELLAFVKSGKYFWNRTRSYIFFPFFYVLSRESASSKKYIV
jgi:hypothetical protein